MSLQEAFGPFVFSDNKHLAKLANDLSLAKGAFGPYPGETIRFTGGRAESGRCGFIELDRALMDDLLARQARFLASPSRSPFAPISAPETPRDRKRDLVTLEAELDRLTPALLRSGVGLLALSVNEYLDGPLGPRRILLRFHEPQGKMVYQYALDFAESRFVRDETPSAAVLETFPFGLEVYLDDFLGILEGRLQIWDLAGTAMRSWFLGSIYDNLVAFLYAEYGEQARPDLATKVYERALRRVEQGRVAS